MAGKAILLAAAFVTMVLAGCSGGKAATVEGGAQATAAATADPVPDAGSIRGIVVDDSQLPLQGAVASIVDLGVEATTDEGGAFVIVNLAPGTYKVFVAKLGYESQGVALDVLPNQETTKTFILTSIALEEVSVDVFGPYNGFLVCGWSVYAAVYLITGDCPVNGVSGNYPLGEGKNAFRFKQSQTTVHSSIGETMWSPSAAGTSPKLSTFFSYQGSGSTHWWCAGAGSSPVSFVYSTDEDLEKCTNKGQSSTEPKPTKKLTLELTTLLPFVDFRPSASQATNAPVFLTFQQKFTSMSSLFYGEGPPEGYSVLPDA